MVLLILVGGVLTAVISLAYRGWTISVAEPYHIWILLYSTGVFAFGCKYFNDKLILKNALVNKLSKASYCIYVIHPILINFLYKGLHFYPNCLPAIIGELLIWIFVATVSIIGSTMIRRLPGFRKIM